MLCVKSAGKKINIDLNCEPRLFDAIVELVNEQPLDFDVCVVDALLLAEYLKIQGESKEEAFCKGLAQVTKNDEAFRKEAKKNMNKISNVNMYLLLLMKDYAGAYGIEVRIEGNKVALCCKPVEKKPRPIDKTVVVNEIKVVGAAMDMIRNGGEKVLYILMWFADVMDMRGLYISNCEVDADIMKSISDV